jgi:hypothetical protein
MSPEPFGRLASRSFRDRYMGGCLQQMSLLLGMADQPSGDYSYAALERRRDFWSRSRSPGKMAGMVCVRPRAG